MFYFSLLYIIHRYKTQLWGTIVVSLIMIFTVILFVEREKSSAPYANKTLNLQSVSTLPQDLEETWINYVRKRIDEEIQREGNNLRVRTTHIGMEPSYTYVSLNYPYEIDCNTFDIGIGVHFGTGEDSISANITGAFSVDYKNEPEHRVDPSSISYKNLDEKLCRIVAKRLTTIISQPIPHPSGNLDPLSDTFDSPVHNEN